jgi:hypothetical protein
LKKNEFQKKISIVLEHGGNNLLRHIEYWSQYLSRDELIELIKNVIISAAQALQQFHKCKFLIKNKIGLKKITENFLIFVYVGVQFGI